MLKINLVSDIHLEFYTQEDQTKILDKILETECDVLVIAGDFCTQSRLSANTTYLAKSGRQIVYVVGNHEYYGKTPHDIVHTTLKNTEAQHPNFHWLHNTLVKIKGVVFAGTPMWHEFDIAEDLADAYNIADIKNIAEFVPFVQEQHYSASKFLKNVKADVIVTHHLPSYKCVSPRYQREVTNKFFVHPILEKLTNQPTVWCYGHTHDRGNQKIGKTQVIGNPMGYPNENATYQPCIIEL